MENVVVAPTALAAGIVPPQEPAVTPGSAETVPPPVDGTEPQSSEQTPAEKRLTQAEVDTIVQREKAKAEAKAERRANKAYRDVLERMVPRQTPAAASEDRPKQEQFTTVDDYIEAVADWKFKQRESEVRQSHQQEQQRTIGAKTEILYAKASEIAGFDRESFDSLPLTATIAAAVTESDIAPRLMAHMASNPDEVQRIAYMSPARQAAEIGRLEAKILAAPPPAKPSKAPAPITPVGGNSGTVDKDPKEMSQKEFNAWRAKQIKQRH